MKFLQTISYLALGVARLFLEDTGNFTNKILLIENIEKVQAKDVKIFVNSDWNLNKDYDKLQIFSS